MKLFFAGVPGGNHASREVGLVTVGIYRRLITFFYKDRAMTTLHTFGKVVHCKKEPHDVYIGRPSKWGNPFSIGLDGNREEVILKYEAYIRARPDLLKALPELKGKTLGCWCSPHPCHGDVLVKLIEEICK